ncbi:hypothetical protein AURDEDRAFT_172267 [Auricularia subglabra TFB-10046 SS5]|nr:hypothetical protein AURDEDRAFT_172267 [Auricularia subglabra TFB-10046 SS5]
MAQDIPATPNDDDDVSDDEIVAADEPEDDVFAQDSDSVAIAQPLVTFPEFREVAPDQTDTSLRDAIRTFDVSEAPPPARALYRDATSGFTRINVAPAALDALRCRQQVNEEIVYAGIASLVAEHAARNPNYALFQPYDYTMWNNAKQRARVFKSVQATEFWRRNAILIPIYEDEHWMLAIAYPRHSKIDFFDSMGLRSRHTRHAKAARANMVL